MSGGHSALAAIEGLHRAKGVSLTLHRTGVSPDVDVFAKVFSATGADLAGSMTETARRMRITNAAIAASGWPGPPRAGDAIGAYLIEQVDTRSVGDVVVLHILDVAKAG